MRRRRLARGEERSAALEKDHGRIIHLDEVLIGNKEQQVKSNSAHSPQNHGAAPNETKGARAARAKLEGSYFDEDWMSA